MIRLRDRLFHKRKDLLNQHVRIAYNLFRNRITREIKKVKNKFYKEYFENNLNNMKKTWQGIKQLINLNNKTGRQINQIYHEGKYINTNWLILSITFFTNIGPGLDKEIPISH